MIQFCFPVSYIHPNVVLYWNSILKTTFLKEGGKKTNKKRDDMNMGKENIIAVSALSNICPEGPGHWNGVCQFGPFYWSSGNESWKTDWHFVSWPLPVSHIEIISWLFWNWEKHELFINKKTHCGLMRRGFALSPRP